MINCIVAVDQGRGIGFNGQMPWPRLAGDMSWFKSLTTDNVIIMGSTTWHSLGRKLPNRINVVISRWDMPGADHRYFNITDAIDAARLLYPEKEIFIVGGQALYDSTMPIIDRFYITQIEQKYICDKFFNLTYVYEHFLNVQEHKKYTDSVTYTIKEYSK